jgi:uncharacterized membrane protein YtjA (UPF0391 family)
MNSPYRVDVGIRLHLFCPTAVSSSWAERQVRTLRPTRPLRFSLAFLVVAHYSSSTGSNGLTRTISILSFMFSLAVVYLLVSLKPPISLTFSLRFMGRVLQRGAHS